MGMPSVNVSFTEKASQAISRGERGVVAIIIKDTVIAENPFTVLSSKDIPQTLSAGNKKQIEMALLGYQNTPKKIICYVVEDGTEITYTNALNYFEVVKFDYLAIPTVETDGKVQEIVSWIKAMRNEGKKYKAVLPNAESDYEGIINFTTSNIITAEGSYTTEQYCARIAGLIAGTPLTISCTYAPLAEVVDCDRLTKAQMDTAVDTGNFFIFYDGDKVKVARGVNSLVTTNQDKGNQFKKIKIVEVMDMIYDDITKTAQDSYLGKFSNSYDNKCLLISAIGGYFEQLIIDEILSEANIDIDVDAQRIYLKSKGVVTDELKDNDIRLHDTDDKVFLKASIKILDAIEEIILPINI